MMRLRDGKWRASGWVPGGCSASSTPSSPIRACSAAFSGGQAMSRPLAITPTVPVLSDPSCAAVSMPRASPLTTSQPSRPSSAASSRASFARGGGRVARAHHRHRRSLQQLGAPLHRQHRRCAVGLSQQRGVGGLAQEQERRAQPGAHRPLPLGALRRRHGGRLAPAPRGQGRAVPPAPQPASRSGR